MNKTMKKRFGNKGQGMVEFALIAPLLILFMLIIIDLGRITYSYSALHNAVREGARYGIIYPDNISIIQDRTKEYAIGLRQADLAVAAVHDSDNKTIKVSATYDFRTASPILTIMTGSDTFQLSAESLMNTEN